MLSDLNFHPLEVVYYSLWKLFIYFLISIIRDWTIANVDVETHISFPIDSDLTLVLLNCFKLFFIHLKLELLTQFPASKDEKYFYLWKINISQIEIFD